MFLLVRNDNNLIIEVVSEYTHMNGNLTITKNGKQLRFMNCSQRLHVVEVADQDIPSDCEPMKYFYENDNFVLNPDFIYY